MNTIPIPDLDNDEVTYVFRNAHGFPTRYDIWRSINGGPEHLIGEVRKIRDSGWNQSAQWRATGIGDDPKSGGGDTRAAAARSLEHSLQPTEWHERKRAEYLAEDAARREEQAQREADYATQRAELEEVSRLLGGYGTVKQNGPGEITFTLYEIRRLNITRSN